ncbi:MAG: tetratricopeptide repeat protein [Desulfocapsa sp.]|nr:tetratricopeptide repeat protein [Desulfocapsa sp.]
MTEQSAFNQNQVAENAYVEPTGALDQLNLPPAVVRFIRKNKLIIQISGALIVVGVVSGSLYQSYSTDRIESSASNLSISMEAEGENKIQALEHVVSEFSGTSSALWATVELGHVAMKNNEFSKAAEYYTKVRSEISDANPMKGLLIFGIAQAEEAEKKYSQASTTYSALKGIDGYKNEGFIGMARVLEAEGKNKEAVAVYEEFLGTFLGENQNAQLTKVIQEKITRLRNQ